MDYCHKNAIENIKYKALRVWLRKKFKSIKASQSAVFGSSVFSPEKAYDIDVVILLSVSEKNKILDVSKKINVLKKDFKIKYKRNLHLSIFNSSEMSDYLLFIEKNPYKIDITNG
jgi:predicted nucleotidyltransferase